MKQITFIAQFPPPIHGLSKAVDTLYNSRLNKSFQFRAIDITNNRHILRTLYSICFSHSDLYYFTISQTKGGNWRDLIILKLLEWKHAKCLIHLHGGYYRTLIERDCGSFQKQLNYEAIGKLAGCIVLGESLQPIFEGMIDKEKIYTVPNCVDDQYVLSLLVFFTATFCSGNVVPRARCPSATTTLFFIVISLSLNNCDE